MTECICGSIGRMLDEPFEGLAPAVVNEVMEALVKLWGKVAMIVVEHHAETVLSIVDKAYVPKGPPRSPKS